MTSSLTSSSILPGSKYTSNAWKKFAKGEDKQTKQLKDWFRDIARRNGCGCVEEEHFVVDLHDTNPLLPKGTMRSYPVDLYITRRKPPLAKIIDIDGEYHDTPEQKEKDRIRDEAIKARYPDVDIHRFDKEALLNGDYTEESIVERLGLA